MTIQVGDRLPAVSLKKLTPDGIKDVPIAEVTKGKKVVLFAVPGAFTPTCSEKHFPGFVDQAGDITAKGVDAIVCVAVNDPFVLGAWEKVRNVDGKVNVLSDGNAEFTRALGLDFDGSAVGLGTRSKRYAMVVDDGVVKALMVEDAPAQAEKSSASADSRRALRRARLRRRTPGAQRGPRRAGRRVRCRDRRCARAPSASPPGGRRAPAQDVATGPDS